MDCLHNPFPTQKRSPTTLPWVRPPVHTNSLRFTLWLRFTRKMSLTKEKNFSIIWIHNRKEVFHCPRRALESMVFWTTTTTSYWRGVRFRVSVYGSSDRHCSRSSANVLFSAYAATWRSRLMFARRSVRLCLCWMDKQVEEGINASRSLLWYSPGAESSLLDWPLRWIT